MARRRLIVIAAISLLAVGSLRSTAEAQAGLDYEQYLSYQARGAEEANAFWREVFEQAKKDHPEFKHEYHDLGFHFTERGKVDESGCGGLSGDPEDFPDSNVDPAFHCPGKNAAFFSSSWLYDDYYLRFGAFAPWVIIAHEVGHHVHRQLGGTDDNGKSTGWIPQKDMELNADCLAGVFAHVLERRGYINEGDSKAGARAVYDLGDEEEDTRDPHGKPQEREDEFMAGYKSGDVNVCNNRLATAKYSCNPRMQACPSRRQESSSMTEPAPARHPSGNPIVTGCFRQYPGEAAWTRTIQLWTNTDEQWVHTAETEGDVNGCADFWIRPEVKFQMLVRYQEGSSQWHGESPVFTMGPNNMHIGQYWVYG